MARQQLNIVFLDFSFSWLFQLRPLREALSTAQADRERLSDELNRVLKAHKELQGAAELLQAELERKEMEMENLQDDRYGAVTQWLNGFGVMFKAP